MSTTAFRRWVSFFCVLVATLLSVASASAAPSTLTATVPSSAALGSPETFTGRVSCPAQANGRFDFSVGATILCSATPLTGPTTNRTASCTGSFPTLGVHTVTVAFVSSTPGLCSSTSITAAVTVKAMPTITLTGTGTSTYGSPTAFKATLTKPIGVVPNPGGSIAFRADGVAIPGCTLMPPGATCAMGDTLAVGNRTITAVYSGDPNFWTVTSSPAVHEITKATPNTSISAIANSYAQPITLGNQTFGLNALVIHPSGAIAISIDGFPACSPATPTGTCMFNYAGTPVLTAGAHTATGAYAGDANYTAATPAPFTFTISKAPGVVTLGGTGTTTYGGAVAFTATVPQAAGPLGTASPTGTVTFNDGGTAIPGCTSVPIGTSCTATSLTVGPHTINAVYSGDTNYLGAPSSAASHTVNKAAPVVTLTGTGTSTFGAAVAFSATVSRPGGSGGVAPTGNVTFTDGGNPIPGCTNVSIGTTCATTALSVATHAIGVSYAGDGNYVSGVSTGASHVVSKANTTTTIASSGTPAVAGNSVTLTGTVVASAPGAGTPTGTVDFLDGAVIVAADVPLTASATATFTSSTITAGSHTFRVRYHGDSRFNASNVGGTETSFVQVIDKATTSTSVTKSPAGTSTYGDNVSVKATIATAGSPLVATGNVEFWVDAAVTATATIALDNAGVATFSTATLGAGPHTITVKYAGDATHLAVANVPVLHAVTQVGSSVAVASSQNPQSVTTNVVFTASVTLASGTGTATGTVQFKDGGIAIGAPVSLTGTGPTWTAKLTTNTLAVGSHTITAEYSGSANVVASTGAMLAPQVIQSVVSSITAVVTPAPAVYGEAMSIVVTVASSPAGSGGPITGNVTLTLGGVTTAPLPLVAGVVTVPSTLLSPVVIPAGAPTVTIKYLGDATHDPATGTVILTINKKPTTTTLTSSPNPSVRGENVVLTAVVSSAVGKVTFAEGATTLGEVAVDATGKATLTLSNLSVGTHGIVAIASGDDNHSGSSSTTSNQVVNKAATSTSVASSSNPSTPGAKVTFSAIVTVTAPGAGTVGGTVTFMDGATPIGTPQPIAAAGTATVDVSTLGLGSHNVTAVYSGDGDFFTSTSTALVQSVDQFAAVVTLAATPNPAAYGKSVTLTAHATAQQGGQPGGTITFRDGTTTLGTATLANGSATFTTTASLAPGVHSLEAEYGGDLAHPAGSKGTVVLNVVSNDTTVALTQSSVASKPGEEVTFTATIAASGDAVAAAGATVTFMDGSTIVAANVTATDGVAVWKTSSLTVGSHAITAKFDGVTGFNTSTSAMLTHVVNESGIAPPGEDGKTSPVTPGGGPDGGAPDDGSSSGASTTDSETGEVGCSVVGTGAGLAGGSVGLGAGFIVLLGLVLRRRRSSLLHARDAE